MSDLRPDQHRLCIGVLANQLATAAMEINYQAPGGPEAFGLAVAQLNKAVRQYRGEI